MFSLLSVRAELNNFSLIVAVPESSGAGVTVHVSHGSGKQLR
jgi:hypothetical protein